MDKTPRSSLLRTIGEGTFWISASTVLIKGIGLVSVFLILRTLSVAEYGIAQLALSIFSLGLIFICSNLMDVVIADMGRERYTNPGKMKSIFLSFFRLNLLLAVVGAIGILVWGQLYDAGYTAIHLSSYLWIIALLVLVYPIRAALVIWFNVLTRFTHLAAMSVMEEIFRFGALLLFLYAIPLGITGVLLAQLVGQSIMLLLMLPVFLKLYAPFRAMPGERIGIWAIVLAHGKWNLMLSYVSNLNKNIRVWLIQWLLGPAAVGLYSVANSLIGHTQSLMPLGTVLAPVIPQYFDDRERFTHIVNKSFKYSFFIWLIVSLVAFMAVPPMIIYLFPRYADSLALYQLMLIAMIPSSFATLIVSVFYTIKAQRELFFTYLARIALTLIFVPLMVSLAGLMGVAYEFVITATCFMIIRYLVIIRVLPGFKIRFSDFFTFDEYDRAILTRGQNFIRQKLNRFV